MPKREEEKNRLKISAHTGNRPGASSFVGQHANLWAIRSGSARLKITIHVEETIRVSANILFVTRAKACVHCLFLPDLLICNWC